MTKGRICSTADEGARQGDTLRVSKSSAPPKRRRSGKLCQHPSGCKRFAQGATNLCIGHGGGRRCQVVGCPRSAVGRSNKCVSHGGGRRCEYPQCSKSARGNTGFCFAHGGGARCNIPECGRVAYRSTGLCVGHGAGRKCDYPLCQKLSRWPTVYCPIHSVITEPRINATSESVSTDASEFDFHPSLALETADFSCEESINSSSTDTRADFIDEGLEENYDTVPLLDFLACSSGRLGLNEPSVPDETAIFSNERLVAPGEVLSKILAGMPFDHQFPFDLSMVRTK